MLRRLATVVTVAAALTLAACSDAQYSPTGVNRLQNIDDRAPGSMDRCADFAPSTQALIPWCADNQE